MSDRGSIRALTSASQIAHAGLTFANPMSEADVERAIAALPLPAAPSIVDLGCGNGEILRRALARHPNARGLGVDCDDDALADARRRTGEPRARFERRDASTVAAPFDAALNVASSHAIGGFPAALAVLRALAPVALYGEGFWRRAPEPAFLDALGGATADELADLGGLQAAARTAGFTIVELAIASDRDWAAYEEGLALAAERHGTRETEAYAWRIRARRALPGGTDTLGFALLVLAAE